MSPLSGAVQEEHPLQDLVQEEVVEGPKAALRERVAFHVGRVRVNLHSDQQQQQKAAVRRKGKGMFVILRLLILSPEIWRFISRISYCVARHHCS